MEFRIEDFEVKELEKGKYIKPFLVTYKLNGQKKSWEVVKVYDSVAILIYHKEHKSFILVRQFRAPLYFNSKVNGGVTVELCAGLVDKDLSLEEIAASEIEEECGFRVEPNRLKRVNSFYTSVGFAGSKQTLFYVEVSEKDRVGDGGGIAGEEQIEVIEIPISQIEEFIYNESIPKTPGLLYALCWWQREFI
ncbi:MAG: NUDIX domain-containing protein [Epsilonproteobacteria bacterium]|nr:NUDIX domain-containing protein [Campylobacterota bacterium]